jgi:hypothetical protein
LEGRVKHADASHALVSTRRDRPRRRAAEERDELASSNHSITSSAIASSVGGTSRRTAVPPSPAMNSRRANGGDHLPAPVLKPKANDTMIGMVVSSGSHNSIHDRMPALGHEPPN